MSFLRPVLMLVFVVSVPAMAAHAATSQQTKPGVKPVHHVVATHRAAKPVAPKTTMSEVHAGN